MSMTLDEVMERVKSKDEGIVMAYVRDAFTKMATLGYTDTKVKKYDIIADKIHYELPDEALNVVKVSTLYESNETELITDSTDRNFTGGSTNWTDTDCASFNSTTDLSITNDAASQSCYLDVDDIITIYHRYRLTYDCTLTTGTFELQTVDSSTKLGDFADGTSNVIEFEAPETSELKIVGTASAGEADFDNFSLMEVGLNEYKRARKIVGGMVESFYDEEEGN